MDLFRYSRASSIQARRLLVRGLDASITATEVHVYKLFEIVMMLSLLWAGVSLGLTRGVRRIRTLRMAAPVARKANTPVYFGKNLDKPEEFRGEKAMDPPIVKQDPYFWMRDDERKNKEVIKYLEEENFYCDARMSHLKDLQGELYKEMKSHLKETDEEVPAAYGPYFYYSRSEEGKSYRILCRKLIADGESAKEEIVLDENAIAEGKAFAHVGATAMSSDHTKLAYTVDFTGYETYTVKVKDMATGEELSETIEECSGDIEWGADTSTLFYTLMDDEHRPNEMRMRVFGGEDVSIFKEDDALFWMGIGKTRSSRFLYCQLESKETSEVHVVDLKDVKGGADHLAAAQKNMKVMSPRQKMLRYDVDHFHDDFLIVTNKDGAKTNKLCSVAVEGGKWGHAQWKDVKAYDKMVQVDGVVPFDKHVVVFGREGGVTQMWVADTSKGLKSMSSWKKVSFPEKVFSVYPGSNKVWTSDKIRITYTSLISPSQTIDYSLKTGEMTVLKEKEVPLYDKEEFACTRLEALSRDGKTKIPISIVYRKDLALESDGDKGVLKFKEALPLVLTGYGSYGMSHDPSFSYMNVPLLKRGVAFAVAHIRGGGEMGYWWYEDEGKYLQKQNTFSDFADCAKSLISSGLTASDRLAINGRSAGGLLMGAVANQNPGLFKCIFAGVPFVDVMSTMADPSIPLTVGEWEEWGNPNEAEYHDYMMSYSPVDNVAAQPYCSMYITAGLNDPRVAYWEPAKWVATLREKKTSSEDKAPLLLKVDMDTGHFSASDRYKYMEEAAKEHAYYLWQILPGSV